MAELVDALASGASGSNTVQVQVLPRAPDHDNFDYFRPQGDFLSPSEARNTNENRFRYNNHNVHLQDNLTMLLLAYNTNV